MTDADVDSLTSAFASATASNVNAESAAVCTARTHPRFGQYKQNSANIDRLQEKRRNEQLERQKKARERAQDAVRRLAMGEVEDEMDMDNEPETMDAQAARHRPYDKHNRNPYRNKLMLSEWLVDIPHPEHMSEEWTMVACPEGRRCLVVASKGKTAVYSKSGFFFGEYQTRLPGGCKSDKSKSNYTLIDCIYSELEGGVYYTLDMLCWNAPMLDSECWESPLRFYWLQSKLSELQDEMGVRSRSNQLIFKPLPTCSCSQDNMRTFMEQEWNFEAKLDGLLFYHNAAIYSPGQTPLVGWLKPFMLPEILGVSVPHKYINDEQAKGSTAEFIDDFNTQREAKINQHKEQVAAARKEKTNTNMSTD